MRPGLGQLDQGTTAPGRTTSLESSGLVRRRCCIPARSRGRDRKTFTGACRSGALRGLQLAHRRSGPSSRSSGEFCPTPPPMALQGSPPTPGMRLRTLDAPEMQLQLKPFVSPPPSPLTKPLSPTPTPRPCQLPLRLLLPLTPPYPPSYSSSSSHSRAASSKRRGLTGDPPPPLPPANSEPLL